MRDWLVRCLSSALALQIAIVPTAASAAATNAPSAAGKTSAIAPANINRLAMNPDRRADLALTATVSALNSYGTYRDLIRELPRKADREFLLKQLGAGASASVVASRVENNGIEISAGTEHITIYVRDMSRLRFRVANTEFTFEPTESAEANMRRLQRLMASGGLRTFLLPEAAAFGVVAAAVSWVAMTGILWGGCVALNINDSASCLKLAVAAPWIAASTAGSALASLVGLGPNPDAVFEVTDIECSESLGPPLKATILDADKKPIKTELHFKETGAPDWIETKLSNGETQKLFMTETFKPDIERTPELTKNDGVLESAKIEAKAAMQLAHACEGRSSKEALKAHFKIRNSGAAVVLPKTAVGPAGKAPQ